MSEIQIKEWVVRGPMMVRASALEPDDPGHPYQQALSQGVCPEDYGIVHPYAEEFAEKSRGELITEIVSLRKELEHFHRVLAMY